MSDKTIIDVSEHQGNIDWNVTKDAVHFAILRVQDGTYADKKLARNVEACERYGIPYYCYGFYRDGGAVEARRMIDRAQAAGACSVRGYVLDVEMPGQSTARIAEGMAALNSTGLDNGVYIANHLWSEYGDRDYGQTWVWVPTYGPNDGNAHQQPPHACDLWQFTSRRSVPGIDYGVDCNAVVNRSLEDFTGGQIPHAATQGSASGSTLDLVAGVISGAYGNGDDRKARLGERYEEVQRIVNRVLSASTDTLADDVLRGDYGDGKVRRSVLGARYDEVQAAVNAKAGVVDIDALARKVINGDYGDGETRRAALGVNYEAVQARVNEMLT